MTSNEVADCRFQLEYRADYSSRYHRRRAAFLNIVDQLFTLIILLAGATTFGQLVTGAPTWVAKAGTAALTLVALIQVVTRLGAAAEMHRQWLKRWISLATQLEAKADPSEIQLREWLAERADIESDCVSELKALRIDCENETSRFMQLSGRQRKIVWWQRLIIQLGTLQQSFPYEPTPELPPPHKS